MLQVNIQLLQDSIYWVSNSALHLGQDFGQILEAYYKRIRQQLPEEAAKELAHRAKRGEWLQMAQYFWRHQPAKFQREMESLALSQDEPPTRLVAIWRATQPFAIWQTGIDYTLSQQLEPRYKLCCGKTLGPNSNHQGRLVSIFGHPGESEHACLSWERLQSWEAELKTHSQTILEQPTSPRPLIVMGDPDQGIHATLARLILEPFAEAGRTYTPGWEDGKAILRKWPASCLDRTELEAWWEQVATDLSLEIKLPKQGKPSNSSGWTEISADFLAQLPEPRLKQIENFYRGGEPSWEVLYHGKVIRRELMEKLLELLRSDERLILLKALGGEGKSTLLRLLALEAVKLGYKVLEAGGRHSSLDQALTSYAGQPLLLLWDRAEQIPQLDLVFHKIRNYEHSVCLVMASRSYEWNYATRVLVNRNQLGSFAQAELGALSAKEAGRLAEKLIESGVVRESKADFEKKIREQAGGFFLATILIATQNRPLQDVLHQVVQEVAGWEEGPQLLHLLGLITAFERVSEHYATRSACPRKVIQLIMRLSDPYLDGLCDMLRGEITLEKDASHLALRNREISTKLYEILFNTTHIIDEIEIISELSIAVDQLYYPPKPEQAKWFWMFKIHLIRQGFLEEAETLFERSSIINPDDAYNWTQWAQLAERMGRIGSLEIAQSSRWLHSKAVEKAPLDGKAWHAWAMLEKRQGNHGSLEQVNTARWLFHKAIQADHKQADALIEWAILEGEFGELGEVTQVHTARWLFSQALKLKPNDAKSLLAWAQVEYNRFGLGSITVENSARGLLSRATKVQQKRTEAWLLWAKLELEAGNSTIALSLLDQAREKFPEPDEKFEGLSALNKSLSPHIPSHFLFPMNRDEKPQKNLVTIYQRIRACLESDKGAKAFQGLMLDISRLLPHWHSPLLRQSRLEHSESDVILMQALPEAARPDLVVIGTRLGQLFCLRQDEQGNYALRDLGLLHDFLPKQDQMIGLYWDFMDYGLGSVDLIVISRRRGVLTLLKFALDREMSSGVWRPCPIKELGICQLAGNLPLRELVQRLKIGRPELHTNCAYWVKDQLWSCYDKRVFFSDEPHGRRAYFGHWLDFVPETKTKTGPEWLIAQANHQVSAYSYSAEPFQNTPKWSLFFPQPPLCLCVLPESQPPQVLISQEGGDLGIWEYMPTDWGESLWQAVIGACKSWSTDDSPEFWILWAEQLLKQPFTGLEYCNRSLRAAVLCLLVRLMRDRELMENHLTRIGPLFHQPIGDEDYELVVKALRNIVRSWESASGPLRNAALVLALYRYLPYHVQNMLDLVLQRHLSFSKGDVFPLRWINGKEQVAYSQLLEHCTWTPRQILEHSGPLEKAAIWVARALFFLAPCFHKRYPDKQDGILWRLRDPARLYWLTDSEISYLDTTKEVSNTLQKTSLNLSMVASTQAPSLSRQGFLLVKERKLSFITPEKPSEPVDLGQLPPGYLVMQMTPADDEHAFLIAVSRPNDDCEVNELWLWSYSQKNIVARACLALDSPRELGVLSNSLAGWQIATHSGSQELILLEVSREGEQLQVHEEKRRELEGRLSAMRVLHLEKGSCLLLVGTHQGTLNALRVGPWAQEALESEWVFKGQSSIRHIDAIASTRGEYWVACISALGESRLFNAKGHLLWNQEMHVSLRSCGLFVQENKLYFAVSDVRGVLALYCHYSGNEALEEAWSFAQKAGLSQKQVVHDEGTMLRRIRGANPWSPSVLDHNWSQRARTLWFKQLAEAALHGNQEAQDFFTLGRDSCTLIDLEYLALLEVGSPERTNRVELLELILNLVEALHNKPSANWTDLEVRKSAEPLARILCSLGAGWLSPEYVKTKLKRPWMNLPQDVRTSLTVQLAIVQAKHSPIPPYRDLAAYVEQIEATARLGPEAFACLALLAPPAYLHLARAHGQLYQPFAGTPVAPLSEKQIETALAPLEPFIRTPILALSRLRRGNLSWAEMIRFAMDLTEHRQISHSQHPILGYIQSLFASCAPPPAFEQRPKLEQQKFLANLEQLLLPIVPVGLDFWNHWLEGLRSEFRRQRNAAIQDQIAKLNELVRLWFQPEQVLAYAPGEMELELALIPEGEASASTMTQLRVMGERDDTSELLHQEFVEWRKLTKKWKFRFQTKGFERIFVELITHLSQGEQSLRREIDLSQSLGLHEQGWMDLFPPLADRVITAKPVPQQFRIAGYDPDLGRNGLWQAYDRANEYNPIDLDREMRAQRNNGHFLNDHEWILSLLGHRDTAGSWTSENRAQVPVVAGGEQLASRLTSQTPERLLFLHGLAQMGQPGFIWLLPVNLAIPLHAELFPAAEYQCLYQLTRLDEPLTEFLRYRLGLTQLHLQKGWQLCNGHLSLLRLWLETGMQEGETQLLKSREALRLLQRELKGLDPQHLLHLLALAQAIQPFPEAASSVDLSQLPTEQDRRGQTTWVRAYPLTNGQEAHVPPELEVLLQIGTTLSREESEKYRQILVERAVLQTNGSLGFVRQPYLEILNALWQREGRLLPYLGHFYTEPLLSKLSWKALAAIGPNLQQLLPEAKDHAQHLASLMNQFENLGRDAHTRQDFFAQLGLTNSAPDTANQSQGENEDWCAQAQRLVGEPLSSCNLNPELRLYCCFLKEEKAGVWQKLHHLLEKGSPENALLVVFILQAKDLPEETSTKLCVIQESQIRAFMTNADLPKAFRLTLRNRAGLTRIFQTHPLPGNSPVFVGRTEELQTILTGIDHSSYLITGARQIGKTSLLNQVQARLAESGRRALIWLNLFGVSSWEAFQRELTTALRALGLASASPLREIADLRPLFAAIDRPVLLLNEADGLLLGEPRILEILRCLSEERIVQTVFTGYLTLYKRTQDPESMFYNWTKGRPGDKALILGLLSRDNARELILKLEQEPLELEWESESTREACIEQLMRASRRIPVVLQAICSELVNYLNRRRRYVIRIQDIVQYQYANLYAWDYLNKPRIKLTGTVDELQTALEARARGEQEWFRPEEDFWGKWVLAVMVAKLYEADEMREDLEKVDASTRSMSWSVVRDEVATWARKSEYPDAEQRIHKRFGAREYHMLLDFWTLTIILTPRQTTSTEYYFQDHIYPLELFGWLENNKTTIKAHITLGFRDLYKMLLAEGTNE